MKTRQLLKLAPALERRLGGHMRAAAKAHTPKGITQTDYLRAVADSDQAMQTARYLADYHAETSTDRAAFLNACGLRWMASRDLGRS